MERVENNEQNKWAINWDDPDGGDVPGEGDIIEIFLNVIHNCYMG